MTRLVPGLALPAYSFVPRRFPHPHSDPGGHRFGHDLPEASVPDPERWAESLHYLVGIDLFNHGYYWEAHEAWESLWNACGRRGPLATFFKALIQWAVVGVKAREQCAEGVVTHSKRAKELLEETAAMVNGDRWLGLSLGALIANAQRVVGEPPVSHLPESAVEIVFPFSLNPQAPG
jgi:uncharacterized protein